MIAQDTGKINHWFNKRISIKPFSISKMRWRTAAGGAGQLAYHSILSDR
jgi:hypothetical protein